MSWWFWTGVAVFASPFAVRLGFMAMCTAKRLYESGIKLSYTDWIVIVLAFAIGYPADAIYNNTVGVIRFGEFRKLLYSSRIQYYVDTDKFRFERSKKQQYVNYWFQYLNVADPGHIHPKR